MRPEDAPARPSARAGNVSIGRAAKAAAWDLQKPGKPGVPDLATPKMGAAVMALCLNEEG